MKRKMTITVAIPKPRNPLHLAMASKRGGGHQKSDKTLRAQAKMDLKKNQGAGRNTGSFLFPKAFLLGLALAMRPGIACLA